MNDLHSRNAQWPTGRVSIEYDVSVGEATIRKALPFVVGVLADLSGEARDAPRMADRKFVEIDRENFERVLKRFRPCISLTTRDHLNETGEPLAFDLEFSSLSDFEPDAVTAQLYATRPLLEARSELSDLVSLLFSKSEMRDVLRTIARDPARIATLAAAVGEEPNRQPNTNDDLDRAMRVFAREIAARAPIAEDELLEARITARIDEIDQRLTAQTNEILHSSTFQKLEATWRGLHYLVQRTDTSLVLKIAVLHAPFADIVHAAESLGVLEDGPLYRIVAEELSIVGGRQFSMFVADYEFSRDEASLAALRHLAELGSAVHAPVIAAAHCSLFGLEGFHELGRRRQLAAIFDSIDYRQWNAFRESDESRYVALCLPRALLRQRYGAEDTRIENFAFEEKLDPGRNEGYLWGNVAYLLAARITAAFASFGWCAAIRGIEGGGLVEHLPVHAFETDDGDIEVRCATEIAITDRREAELDQLGFIPLVHCVGTDYAAFFSSSTVNKPKKYDTSTATRNSWYMSQLPYVFAISRFAQGISAMIRDTLEPRTREELEHLLHDWLMHYVLLTDDVSDEVLASYPLRDARIDVEEVVGDPGHYRATLSITPRFQLDETHVNLQCVVKLARGRWR